MPLPPHPRASGVEAVFDTQENLSIQDANLMGRQEASSPRHLVEQKECRVFSFASAGSGFWAGFHESWMAFLSKRKELGWGRGSTDKEVANGKMRES